MDFFGKSNPKEMPIHFFLSAIDIDYATAIRANIELQDYSVCPRHWYIDARFRCKACENEFLWPAEEQKTWFEEFGFYVDSRPTLCRECRARRRDALELRRDYDAQVSHARSHGGREEKIRIIEIVDELENYWGNLPARMIETRELFRRQLRKLESM